jgi:hypothetical protein
MPQSDVRQRPTLLNSCAMAATAAEAKFRIEYSFLPRDSRIVAVDAAAAVVVRRASQRHWSGAAHFLTFDGPAPSAANGSPPDATLRTCDGTDVWLSNELASADVTVMVAGSASPEAAAVIGRACAERGIMTAGVALAGAGDEVNDAVLALRPHAMVLVVSTDEDDLLELLTALRV